MHRSQICKVFTLSKKLQSERILEDLFLKKTKKTTQIGSWQTFVKCFCQTLSWADGNSWVVTDFEKMLEEPFSRAHCITPVAVPHLRFFIVSMHNLHRAVGQKWVATENGSALIYDKLGLIWSLRNIPVETEGSPRPYIKKATGVLQTLHYITNICVICKIHFHQRHTGNNKMQTL